MKKIARKLHILMNGRSVGILEKLSNAELQFSYDENWLNSELARPISLSLPLRSTPFIGEVVNNFFDNLLPDNSKIRERIQRKFQIPTQQPYDLLSVIGEDCVGAIQLVSGRVPQFKEKINCESLDDHEIADILNGYQNNPLGMKNIEDDFRISIAGAQEKAAFLYYNGRWNRPLGNTPTTHIFKLPIGIIQHQQIDLSDSCENEWLCSKIISEFGVPVADCEIQKFDKVKVLIVKRFDRVLAPNKKWIIRLPQEDMCQALGFSPNLKYQSDGGPGIKNIMNLLLGAKNPIEDRNQFYKSQILFWLLAAIDGHAKNFSILIEPSGQYKLTPLYDIMSAYPLIANKQLQAQKIKMAMSLRGKNNHYHWFNIQRRHFLETANYVNFSPEKAEKMLEEVLSQVDAVINSVSKILPRSFPEHISSPIFEGMQKFTKMLM